MMSRASLYPEANLGILLWEPEWFAQQRVDYDRTHPTGISVPERAAATLVVAALILARATLATYCHRRRGNLT